MKARSLRRWMNIWPPFLFSGIRILSISDDFREAVIELRDRRLNMNYVGVHFGGAIFSMTDPFHMLLAMNLLGRGYVVWDKAAHIEYLKPGKGTLRAHFRITDEMLAEVRANTLHDGDKYFPEWPVEVMNADGETVARVFKTLYIRKGMDNRKRISDRSVA
jgi:acyl-coenzyme A thioesterase PaaI-like protein